MCCQSRIVRWVGVGIVVVCLPALLIGAERRAATAAARAKASAAAEQAAADAADDADAPANTVELFAAMKSKDIEVKFIPKDDREARVIIKNNTKQPLTVQLPEAFAGVPVLAQRRPAARTTA